MNELPSARLPLFAAALSLLLCSFGCGYHVAGKGNRLPPDVKTIAIPIFTNATTNIHIEQMVAGDVTREFIERTSYRITPKPEGADAVLNGSINDIRSIAVAFDLTTGRATTLQLYVRASVQLIDSHSHKVLFSNPNYLFREQYQVSPSESGLFEEDQPALQRLSRDFARTLVTDILENF